MAVLGQAQAQGAGPGAIPFANASNQYAEQFFSTAALQAGAATAEQGPFNILPGGFIRGVWLHFVNTTGGTTAGAAGTDSDFPGFPFSTIFSVTFEDINGAPIMGPLTGWELYLINKYHGYFPLGHGDPTINTGYDPGIGTGAGNLRSTFSVWIPIVIRSDGLGALANTDARAQYRLRWTLNSTAAGAIMGLTPTLAPIFTATGVVEYFAQVDPQDLSGVPQQQTPPALGTTQFTVHESISGVAASASITYKHNRVGNRIRNFTYYFNNSAAPPRTIESLTSPIRIRMDNRYLRIEPTMTRITRMGHLLGLTPALATGANVAVAGVHAGWNGVGSPLGVSVREPGVYTYNWSDGIDNAPSPADDGGWLGTNESTFLQLEDTLSATTVTTGTLLTNDVAVASGGAQ